MEGEENWRQYEILGVEGPDGRRNKQKEKEEIEREEKEQSDGEWEREIEKEREEEQRGKTQEEMEEEEEWRQFEEQTGEIKGNREKGKMNIESKEELEQKPAAAKVEKKGNKESKGEKRKTKVFILQMNKVISIDAAGINALEEIYSRMVSEKIILAGPCFGCSRF